MLGAVVVSLLAIEGALRLTGHERGANVNVGFGSWAGPDSELGWVNSLGHLEVRRAGPSAMTSRLTAGGTIQAADKSAKRAAILIVVCSFTEG